MIPRRLALSLVPLFALAAAPVLADGPVPAPPPAPAAPATAAALEEVAKVAGQQWTGVAVSKAGRVFACFPRWLAPYDAAVVEVLSDGTRKAWPDASRDGWDPESIAPVGAHWVCVQSVRVDAKDRLWVLDPASPAFGGVVAGGPKLVAFDLATGQEVKTYRFDPAVAAGKAYLNDVRIDAERGFAYLTDSGLGALVVLNLESGAARRFLENDPRTKAEPAVRLAIGGKELHFNAPQGKEGPPPEVHADGIALDAKGDWLYWQALTGKTLYRVKTSVLRDAETTDAEVAAAVESLGATVASDGLEIDAAGNVYLTSIEQGALVVRRPDGTLLTLAKDDRLVWPDSLAFGPGDTLYVACSQIHRTPMVHPNAQMPKEPFRILRLKLPPR